MITNKFSDILKINKEHKKKPRQTLEDLMKMYKPEPKKEKDYYVKNLYKLVLINKSTRKLNKFLSKAYNYFPEEPIEVTLSSLPVVSNAVLTAYKSVVDKASKEHKQGYHLNCKITCTVPNPVTHAIDHVSTNCNGKLTIDYVEDSIKTSFLNKFHGGVSDGVVTLESVVFCFVGVLCVAPCEPCG